MIDLLQYILTNIVDHPDAIRIDETVDPTTNLKILNLTVHPEDMGKVIGKGGKIITAIRELVRIKAIKTNQRVKVVLLDQINPVDQPEPPESLPQTSES